MVPFLVSRAADFTLRVMPRTPEALARRLVIAAAPAVVGAASGLAVAPHEWRPFVSLALAGLAAGAALPDIARRVDDGAAYGTAWLAVALGLCVAFGLPGMCASIGLGPPVALALTIYLWIPPALERGSAVAPTLEDAPRWWRAIGIWLACAALPTLAVAVPWGRALGIVTALAGAVVALAAHRRLRVLRRLWQDARDGENGLALVERGELDAPALLRDHQPLDAVIVRAAAGGPYRGNPEPVALAPRDWLQPAGTPWGDFPRRARSLAAFTGAFFNPVVACGLGLVAANLAHPASESCGAHWRQGTAVGVLTSIVTTILGAQLLARLEPSGRPGIYVTSAVVFVFAALFELFCLMMTYGFACWN